MATQALPKVRGFAKGGWGARGHAARRLLPRAGAKIKLVLKASRQLKRVSRVLSNANLVCFKCKPHSMPPCLLVKTFPGTACRFLQLHQPSLAQAPPVHSPACASRYGQPRCQAWLGWGAVPCPERPPQSQRISFSLRPHSAKLPAPRSVLNKSLLIIPGSRRALSGGRCFGEELVLSSYCSPYSNQ